MMEILISEQLNACAAFAVLGALTGLLYDLVRFVRYLAVPFGVGGAASFAADLVLDALLMLLLTAAVPVTAYCFSYGRLRAFGVVSFLAALAAYRATAGKPIHRAALRGACLLRRLIGGAVHVLAMPFALILRLVRHAARIAFALTFGRALRLRQKRRLEAYYAATLDGLREDVIF